MNWIKTALVLVILGITFLSLKSPSASSSLEVNDKVGHFIAYAVLTINLCLLTQRKHYFWMALIAFGYSCLMEYLQGFVPGRTVDYHDLIANGLGALIGLSISLLLMNTIKAILKKLKLMA